MQTIERLWSETVTRAQKLPEPVLHERVDDEWSFVETLRQLIFATDAWASRTILDEPMAYDQLGSPTPPTRDDAIALGIDPDAYPTDDEVLEIRADRLALVRGIVDGLTDTQLRRTCARAPRPAIRRSCVRCVSARASS